MKKRNKMKCSKVTCTFIMIIFILTALLAFSIWYIISRKEIEKALENFRRRRSSRNDTDNNESTVGEAPRNETLEVIEANENNRRIYEEENLLAAILAKELITCPEDVLKFIEKENFGCKEINRTLNVFRRNYHGEFSAENAYIRLFRSLRKFHHMLCDKNDKYRIFFMPFQDDFVRLHEQLEDCKGQLDWYEKNNETACSEGQKILDCYYDAIAFEMGDEIAFYYNHIFMDIINAAMVLPCKFTKRSKDKLFKSFDSSRGFSSHFFQLGSIKMRIIVAFIVSISLFIAA